jgi:predicted DNA-binding transcriptional regulator AlpA
VSPASTDKRLLLTARETWERLGCAKTKFYALLEAGYLPAPVELGRTPYWRAEELRDYVRANCPHRSDWNWRPALPAKLEQYLSVLREEVLDLQAQIADLEGRKARGENAVTIRAR